MFGVSCSRMSCEIWVGVYGVYDVSEGGGDGVSVRGRGGSSLLPLANLLQFPIYTREGHSPFQLLKFNRLKSKYTRYNEKKLL